MSGVEEFCQTGCSENKIICRFQHDQPTAHTANKTDVLLQEFFG